MPWKVFTAYPQIVWTKNSHLQLKYRHDLYIPERLFRDSQARGLNGRGCFENLREDGRIILKMILNNGLDSFRSDVIYTYFNLQFLQLGTRNCSGVHLRFSLCLTTLRTVVIVLRYHVWNKILLLSFLLFWCIKVCSAKLNDWQLFNNFS